MTPFQSRFFKEFLEQVFDHSCYVPATDFYTSRSSVTLFNPCLQLAHMLYYFEKFGKSVIENTVDPIVYESSYYTIHRQERPYFFSCPVAPPKELGLRAARNVTGLVHGLYEQSDKTMTVAEAMLYVLFQMYTNKQTVAFDGMSVVTLTTESDLNIPLVVGFDEETVSNRIQPYNATMMMGSTIGTHAISYKAAFE